MLLEAPALRLLDGDDVAPERTERHRDELQFASPSGIPMIVRHSASPVTMRTMISHQPTTTTYDHVADRGSGAGVLTADHRLSEWPQGEHGDPQRGHAERDRDDQKEHDQRRQCVAERRPEACANTNQITFSTSRIRAQPPIRSLRPGSVGGFARLSRVVDVWESEEAVNAFAEQLAPVLQEVGVEGEPQVYPAHSFVSA